MLTWITQMYHAYKKERIRKKIAANIPKMAEVTVQSLSIKLQVINRN